MIEPFQKIPEGWDVFQSLDHGFNHPTAVLTWIADGDGNFIIGRRVRLARLGLQPRGQAAPRPSGARNAGDLRRPVRLRHQGLEQGIGRERRPSVASEYVSQGIRLLEANNDRVAGYGRLRPRLPAIAESS